MFALQGRPHVKHILERPKPASSSPTPSPAPAPAHTTTHTATALLVSPRQRRPLTRSPDPVRQSEERERLFAQKAKSHADLKHLAPAQRMSVLARRVVENKNKAAKCIKCWLPPRLCMCPVPSLSSPHRFGVYMHFKEYLNASNTGKLLLSTPHARLFILGIEEQERELVTWIANEMDRTLVLFPSRDSITVDQFKAKRAACNADPNGPLNVIVLDGTWTQAKHLHSHLSSLVAQELIRRDPSLALTLSIPTPSDVPAAVATSPPSPSTSSLSSSSTSSTSNNVTASSSLVSPSNDPLASLASLPASDSPTSSPATSPPQSPRSISVPSFTKVRLQPSRPSAFRARTQSQPDRICTIEAVAMLMEEMDGAKAQADVAVLEKGLATVCERARHLGRRRIENP